MKKLLGILAIIIVLIIVATFLIGGLGFGTGNGDGDGEGTAASNRSEQAEQITDEVVEENPEPVQTEPGDNNEDSEEGTILEVSVVKSEYFYQNKSIELSAFVEIVKGVDGKLVVEITDDNAALRAYNKLIDELEAMDVLYIEEAGN